ncbi:hypothetical protein [Chitinophaga sp. HK235]|uniref:hypothetical protein n=1 Tax=Chitinophaga sp. HK235 TaxID=2952571 RepID=UPI001BA7E74F|nr:hypothetical protein [Chitinophaga sp. HK235]
MFSLIIKDCIDRADLLVSLSQFFKNEVSIAYLDTDKERHEDVVYECIPMKGDFCIALWIYTDLKFDVKILSIFLCHSFKTEILISDNLLNPYTWILITDAGEQGVVRQLVDENDLFKIL